MEPRSYSNVLVTGGAGFIGSHLVGALTDQGCDTCVLDNLTNPARFSTPRGSKVRLVVSDILDAQALHKLLETTPPDVVFHLAGLHFVPFTQAHPLLTREVNIDGTRNLLASLAELPCPAQLVFASSAAVYRSSPYPLCEKDQGAPDTLYGETKQAAERLAMDYGERTGARVQIARIFNVYGPGNATAHVLTSIIDQLRSGVRTLTLGGIDTMRDFIYIADVVSALLAMSCHSAPIGIFNVGTGLGTPITRILTVLADLLGHKLESRTSVDLVRPSEPHCLIADTRHSNRLLNWTAKYDLRDGLEEYLREEGLV